MYTHNSESAFWMELSYWPYMARVSLTSDLTVCACFQAMWRRAAALSTVIKDEGMKAGVLLRF